MSKSGKNRGGSGGETPDDRILIKKYPNRRLYNTATSAYIVLDDVIDLVKSGTEFVIEDTKTGEDITRTILNQIIFEQEIKPSDFHFPLEFQKQLIAMYGDTYGGMVPDYLTESLKLFASERAQMNKAMGSAINNNTRSMMEFSQNLARQNMEMFRRSWSMFSMTADPATDNGNNEPDETEQSGTATDRQSELDQIQKQIDALQERLKTLK